MVKAAGSRRGAFRPCVAPVKLPPLAEVVENMVAERFHDALYLSASQPRIVH